MAESEPLTESVQVKFSKRDLGLLEQAAATERLKLSPFIRHVTMRYITSIQEKKALGVATDQQ